VAALAYAVTGKLIVKARSSFHDTTTTWDQVAGDVTADADQLDDARAAFRVDMTSFDAGDWLKNRKLRRDFALDAHPSATFALERVSGIQRDGSSFTATAHGTLRWRGREVALQLAGQGMLDAQRIAAEATFELDVKQLGLSAPKFFLFKIEDVVTVSVTLSGAVK
jgi:polyisoprenoid-binding protein YceI